MSFLKTYFFVHNNQNVSLFNASVYKYGNELIYFGRLGQGTVTTSSGIVKTDSLGKISWAKSIDVYWINDILKLDNGDFFGTGRISSGTSYRLTIFKVSSEGNIIWVKELQPEGLTISSKINRKLLIHADDNTIFLLGWTNKIFKLNGNGELLGQIDFGSIMSTVQYANIENANLVLVGINQFQNSEVFSLVSVVKLDYNLSILEKKRIGIPKSYLSGASPSAMYGFEIIGDFYYILADFIRGASREAILYKIPSDLSNSNGIGGRRFEFAVNQFYLFDKGIVNTDVFGKTLQIIDLAFENYREIKMFSSPSSTVRVIYSPIGFSKNYIYLSNSSVGKIGLVSSFPKNLNVVEACISAEISEQLPLVAEDVPLLMDDISSNSVISNASVVSFSLTSLDLTYSENVICEKIPPVVQSQSDQIYLQAAGSTGADNSTQGIHLRWLLKKDLINHLPKGNLAITNANYNKQNDFVKVYRAPYTYTPVVLDFLQPPKAVENRNALWIYQISGKTFYLYFRNKTKYTTVRNTYNPLTQSLQFIQNYGSEIFELQTPSDLFFAIDFSTSSSASQAKVETEILSVEGTGIREKQLTVRKTFSGAALSNTRMVSENGKSIRFKPYNCEVTGFTIELYSTLSDTIENGVGWTELGQFALSETDSEVFNRLEPTAELVDGKWPRYNDDALVNIQNYKDKWNQQHPSTLSNIKQTVQDYISLSNDENNPTALETFRFSDGLPDGVVSGEDDSFELPNLMLLQQAAMDFHVARMLGLGHLDVDPAVQNSDSFVYMVVYRTVVSLVDGEMIPKNTEHRYITPPVSRSDEKLPLPVDLKVPVPGVFLNNGIGESTEPLTDEDGYTLDGKARFVTLYTEQPEDLSQDKGFYNQNTEFNSTLETFPVFAGIEYKKTGESDWLRPELANTPDYQNSALNGQTSYNETVAIPIPDEGTPLFVHREKENGEHVYSSYGINWFSRITRSTQQHLLTSTIEPANSLLPPSDRGALLVIEESPLLLTTANEQQLLFDITATDKTLVRLLFNYNTEQDLISYKVPPELQTQDALDSDAIFPDNQEVFADEIEIFFRDSMPLNVIGKAVGIEDHTTNELLSKINTTPYIFSSTEESVSPYVPLAKMQNIVGGVLILEETEYIIQKVEGLVNSPVFTVYKKQISDKLQRTNLPNPEEELASPEIRADGKFFAVENLQNVGSWGTPNPHPLKVQIGNNWPIHREVITLLDADGKEERYVQKTRGIWDDADIEKVIQPETVSYDEETGEPTVLTSVHKGQYKATFESAILAIHPQSTGTNPVQWHRGIMRVHTDGDPQGERRNLEVFKIENIGTANTLIVYFTDNSFTSEDTYDQIKTGNNIQVNFYPGYRIYLYADSAAGITESHILPNTGEGIKYSCFGFRSLNNVKSYYSRIAVPTVMFAQEIIEPLIPQLPIGALYATRPDSFGKATYTLTTQYDHTPHGVLFYRVDDDAILNSLYTSTTVATIKAEIAESDPSFLANRWQNVLGFDYDYPPNSFQQDGLFGIYPEIAEGYRLPNPDNPSLFGPNEVPGNIEPGNMVDKIKVAILENFVPLTEIPILYEHISSDSTYRPLPKKQTIRDRNGAMLSPTDADFDMAPMAKIVGANKVQFTDFTLDGTSNNLYFYASKELSATMQMGFFSPILGPIKLVNTNPPQRPAIQQIVPILENTLLGIPSQMEVRTNAYPKIENIKKIALYRTTNTADALSVRTMHLVQEINLETAELLDENIWKISDGFENLPEVPFGDPLFYRVIVFREIEYPDKDDDTIIITEYVPSESSKLMVTTIVENSNPIAPDLTYTSDPENASGELENVILGWEKTAYKAKYYLYKLNGQGQWLKIHELSSNESNISVPLDTTDLGTDVLPLEDSTNDDQSIFHHFKVTVENTSGLLSQEDKISTIPDSN